MLAILRSREPRTFVLWPSLLILHPWDPPGDPPGDNRGIHKSVRPRLILLSFLETSGSPLATPGATLGGDPGGTPGGTAGGTAAETLHLQGVSEGFPKGLPREPQAPTTIGVCMVLRRMPESVIGLDGFQLNILRILLPKLLARNSSLRLAFGTLEQ